MSTLICKDTIQRIGYTVIDGVKVVQYSCVISSDNPSDMRIGSAKLNADMYKNNRDICRADFATFEDAAYAYQDELISKLPVEETGTEEIIEEPEDVGE